jgi:hypothetical protein
MALRSVLKVQAAFALVGRYGTTPEGDGDRRFEDDPPHRRDVAEEAGCEVITAIDGFDALAKIVDHQPSIILSTS